jgi:hypothetical protein
VTGRGLSASSFCLAAERGQSGLTVNME